MKKPFATLSMTLAATVALANIPWSKPQRGDITFFDAAGYGACGTKMDGKTELFAAVSHRWFTSSNPNQDPLCTQHVAVKVDYNGKSVTVPVRDECPSCDEGHVDLSRAAFSRLADLSKGHLHGVTWSFVKRK